MDNARLNGLVALKLVAEKRNFAAAAAQIGISAPARSKLRKQVESRLGVVLLTRTTRAVTLTEAGERFIREAGPAIDTILDVLDSLSDQAAKPSGLLRLNVIKLAYPLHVEPLIAGFVKKYPEVSVECLLDDDPTNVFENGFDAGIRLSDILAKDMVALKLFGPVRFITVAAPKYLDKAGRPKHPRDLHAHRSIVGRVNSSNLYDRWEFEQKGVDFEVHVKASYILNDPISMVNAAVNEMGVLYTTEDLVQEKIKSRKLEVILSPFATSSGGYYLYYPSRSQVQPKLRAFIDHIKSERVNRKK
jgi:DNA-binding transcriptional LysR family regulator